LKQRDKFRKAATQGGSSLSATADNQRKIIKTLRERISSLIKERNTLRSENYIASNKSSNLKKSEARVTQLDSEVAQLKGSIKFLRNKFGALQREKNKLQASIDSSAVNSSADKNQLSKLQNKYQKLYIENNDIKIDFDKLDRKYKQLASDFEAKGNVDVQRLTKANEELSISLQKQKILAYDAISQKSTLEEDLKITRAEANKLSKQLSDLNNVATLNSSLKFDLSEARYEINSLKEELAISKNGATADLDRAIAKIAMLEEALEKSKNKFAELEKQKSSTNNGQQRGFVLSSEWDELKQWITPQQIRFCTILSDYDREKVAAQESGNQLKQNLAIDNRDADIDALLLGRNSQEKGYFRNWIGTVEQVFAIYQENANGEEELAAGVVIKTPCDNVTVGSGRVKSADDERYEGTAFPSDPIYTQLSQVSKGDPILFEGSLLTYQDTGEANRSSKPRFFTNVDSSVNNVEAEKAKKKDKINAPDYFVKIDYLSKL
jgi:chromosome segregation ATPase